MCVYHYGCITEWYKKLGCARCLSLWAYYGVVICVFIIIIMGVLWSGCLCVYHHYYGCIMEWLFVCLSSSLWAYYGVVVCVFIIIIMGVLPSGCLCVYHHHYGRIMCVYHYHYGRITEWLFVCLSLSLWVYYRVVVCVFIIIIMGVLWSGCLYIIVNVLQSGIGKWGLCSVSRKGKGEGERERGGGRVRGEEGEKKESVCTGFCVFLSVYHCFFECILEKES